MVYIHTMVEEEMTMHSSMLAWRVPWPEEPGRLQSMGWQRIRHDSTTKTTLHTHTHTHTRILFSHEKDVNLPICDNMDRLCGHYTK